MRTSGGTNWARAIAAGGYITNSVAVAALTNTVIADTQSPSRYYWLNMVNNGTDAVIVTFNAPNTGTVYTAATNGITIAGSGGSYTFSAVIPKSVYAKTTNAVGGTLLINGLINAR